MIGGKQRERATLKRADGAKAALVEGEDATGFELAREHDD